MRRWPKVGLGKAWTTADTECPLEAGEATADAEKIAIGITAGIVIEGAIV
jgi:hypothetical protein